MVKKSSDKPKKKSPKAKKSSGSPIPSLEYLKGFKFLFLDQNWVNNLLIGAIMVLIPIVGPIVVMGWQCEIFQRLHKKHSQPIPKLDFNDFGHYLGRGIVPFVVGLLVTIPLAIALAIIVVVAGVLIAVAGGKGAPVSTLIPLGVIGAGAVFLFVMIPTYVIANAGMTRAFLTEDFGKSLDLNRIWAYAKWTWPTVFKAALVYLPITMGIMFAGTILLYVGIFPATVIINIAWIYLAWQIYEIYLAQGGESIPIKEGGEPIT